MPWGMVWEYDPWCLCQKMGNNIDRSNPIIQLSTIINKVPSGKFQPCCPLIISN